MRDNSHCFPCCPRGTALISKISRAILARTIAQRKIGSGKETRGKERVDPVKVEDTFAYGRKKLKSRASVRNGIRSRGAVSATFSIPVSLSLSLSRLREGKILRNPVRVLIREMRPIDRTCPGYNVANRFKLDTEIVSEEQERERETREADKSFCYSGSN